MPLPGTHLHPRSKGTHIFGEPASPLALKHNRMDILVWSALWTSATLTSITKSIFLVTNCYGLWISEYIRVQSFFFGWSPRNKASPASSHLPAPYHRACEHPTQDQDTRRAQPCSPRLCSQRARAAWRVSKVLTLLGTAHSSSRKEFGHLRALTRKRQGGPDPQALIS